MMKHCVGNVEEDVTVTDSLCNRKREVMWRAMCSCGWAAPLCFRVLRKRERGHA